MFPKRRLTNPVVSGNNTDPSRSKKQRITDGVKILLDIAKESSDWFGPLKAALGGVNALIKHYEEFKDVKEKVEDIIPYLYRFKRVADVAMCGGDHAEANRRLELSSELARIENRSQELLKKGTVARFVDKGADSGEVAKLVDQLREAIIYYQISQQHAIYERIINLASSFDTLLKLHEKSPAVKNRMDSAMARLDRLCLVEDSDDEKEHERWENLFNTLREIRDKGSVLYYRINHQDYEERQDDIQAVSVIAEDIRDAVLDYQMAQQREIYEQNRKLIDAADLLVLNNCRRAPGAGFQHGNRRGCLRGTRETVLEEIESWIKDFGKSPVFWLNGLAGTGKTTIAQTISERVFADGFLGASFFCSRDFEDRSDLHFIFPTLAFQLAQKHSEFRSVLVPLLRSNPDLVHESLYNQMEKLIVEPLKSAGISTTIVVDALDECEDEEPSSAILSVLGRLVEQIPGVKFVITGRPEPRIETGFRLPLKDATNVFVLHDVQPPLINSDIRLFLRHELSELAHRHQLDEWPSDEQINLLCLRAGGLFVYAVATVKFLDSPFFSPTDQLETITNFPEDTGPEGKTKFQKNKTLDSLYAWILSKSFGEGTLPVFSNFQSIIGTVILLVNPLSPSTIAQLMGLKTEQVMYYLRLIQSLLILENSSQPVKPFHKSFPDFVMDPSRCTDTRFYISPGHLHNDLTANCLRVMDEGLTQNLLSLPDYSLNSEVGDLEARVKNHIGDTLQYACQSWHNHLSMVKENFIGIIPHLQHFLEKKFLAWLEVLSVLKATRGAVVALEKMMTWVQMVAKDEQLLDTARGCFYFVTKFFELIKISATHIYHSALELSPLSSVVRRLYYHQRHAPFPRVEIGVPDSQDLSISILTESYGAAIWSPCGQFVATEGDGVVKIWNGLTLELVSILQPLISKGRFLPPPAYSPDGHSIACATPENIVIWDIQTGGVVKEIQLKTWISGRHLAWSLDGEVIADVGGNPGSIYNVASNVILTFDMPGSYLYRHFWVHNKSFRVMRISSDSETHMATISEVGAGSDATIIESFPFLRVDNVGAFSPTTYHISCDNWEAQSLFIMDIQNSEILLVEEGFFKSHTFSSDGSCFAAFAPPGIHLWKCDEACYTPWRQFQSFSSLGHITFSPTLSSMVVNQGDALWLWHLNHSPIVPTTPSPLEIFSYSGTHIANAHYQGNTITITHLSSQSFSQTIDTGIEIVGWGVTGSVLLVHGARVVMAWLLTEEGQVSNFLGNRRGSCSDSIWTMKLAPNSKPKFLIEGEIGVIRSGQTLHTYNARTGEVLETTHKPQYSHNSWYSFEDNIQAKNNYNGTSSQNGPSKSVRKPAQANLTQVWMKDRQGRCLLWLPDEWKVDKEKVKWFPDASTLEFKSKFGHRIAIKLQ